MQVETPLKMISTVDVYTTTATILELVLVLLLLLLLQIPYALESMSNKVVTILVVFFTSSIAWEKTVFPLCRHGEEVLQLAVV